MLPEVEPHNPIARGLAIRESYLPNPCSRGGSTAKYRIEMARKLDVTHYFYIPDWLRTSRKMILWANQFDIGMLILGNVFRPSTIP